MNVMVVCLDTFRADLLEPDSPVGEAKTPALDQFKDQGFSFDRAFGEGQPTLQFRRACFTGRRSFPWNFNYDRRGHWHHAPGWHKIPPHQDTLAEILLRRGYRTGLIADTYHMFKPTMNYTRGFASYEFIRGQESDNWKSGSLDAVRDQLARHVRNPAKRRHFGTLIQYLWNMQGRETEDDYLCARVFGAAREWLTDNATNSPFMLWIDSFDPHEPWDPPKHYADEHADPCEIEYIMPHSVFAGGAPTEAELQRTKALYLGEASLVDKWVGTLLETVDSLGLADDTLIIITADHGTQCLDHGGFGKGVPPLYAHDTRILWLMRGPGIPCGNSSAIVQSHDLMPTILNALGIEAPADGTSVLPIVRGDAQQLRDHAVIGWSGWADGRAKGRASARDDFWNYSVSTGDEDLNEHLFDLQADPGEHHDIAGQHPEVLSMQRARVETVLGQTLPCVHEETCDRDAPAPIDVWLRNRG